MGKDRKPHPEVAARVELILTSLVKVVGESGNGLSGETWPRWQTQVRAWEEQSRDIQEVVISLIGGMRTGKSTLINALLEARVLPTGGEEACTAAVTEVSYAAGPGYVVRVEFMSRAEWERVADAFRTEVGEPREEQGQETGTERTLREQARAVLTAFYGPDEAQQRLTQGRLELPPEVEKALDEKERFVQAESVADLRTKVAAFVGSSGGKGHKGPLFWPVVKAVKIAGPFATLEGGICLVDLPGLSDPNPARERVTREHLKNCRYIWFVFNMRGVIDKSLSEVITSEQFMDMVLDGRAASLTFVATHSDDFKQEEAQDKFDKPDAGMPELAEVRNEHVRWQVRRELAEQFRHCFPNPAEADRGRQQTLEKAFAQSPVFTVSAYNYLARRANLAVPCPWLSEEATLIPALRQHLQQQCKEFSVQSQVAALQRRLDCLLAELKQEVVTHRLRLVQAGLSGEHLRAVQTAARAVCTSLKQALESLIAGYQTDLETSWGGLDQRLNDALEQADDGLDAAQNRWRTLATGTLQAASRALAWTKAPHVCRPRNQAPFEVDFAKDLIKPLLQTVAFSWDGFFEGLKPGLDRRRQELLAIAEAHGQQLLAAAERGADTSAVEPELKDMLQQTHKLLADHLSEAQGKVPDKIDTTRRQLAADIPLKVRALMGSAFMEAAGERGDGAGKRILGILGGCARAVCNQMHKEVQQTILGEVKRLCEWLLGEFRRMANFVSIRMNKAASSLQPAEDVAAKTAKQRQAALQRVEECIDGLVTGGSTGSGPA